MRGAWKYLTLVGGIAGLAGFFLPFVTFAATDGTMTGQISAFQIVRGIDDVSELMSGAAPALATNEQLRQWAVEFNTSMADYRGAVVGCYVPALLLALVGALAGMRRKMGRLAGLLALAVGAANAGIWLLFDTVSKEETSRDVSAALGLGLGLLLAAGVAGMVGGLGALLLPDRGRAETA